MKLLAIALFIGALPFILIILFAEKVWRVEV